MIQNVNEEFRDKTRMGLMSSLRLARGFLLKSLFLASFLNICQTARAEEVVGLVRENCSGYSNCYTSLAAWEAALGGINFGACAPGDLVCAGKSAVAQIDGTWVNPDTTSVIINGWTTGATNYIRIYTAPSARHDGKWNEASYRLQNAGSPLQINEENVRVDGLQVFMNNTSFSQYRRAIFATLGTAVSDIRISNCVIKSNGNIGQNSDGILFDVTGPNSKFYITNTMIYGFKTSGFYAAGVRTLNTNWTGYMYNVTSNNNDFGFRNNGGTLVAKNSYAGGNTHAAYNGTISRTKCASSDGTGSVGLTGVAYSASGGASFNSVALGTEDFHIKSNSVLKDAGVNTSTEAAPLNFTTDIEGQARSLPWDIGADEENGSLADITPPTAPSAFTAVALSSIAIRLSWTASSDIVGVTGYRIYKDNVHAAVVTDTNYTDAGLAPASLYNYEVSALDAAGNESGRVAASTQTLPASDSTPPSTPGGLTAVAVSSTQINLSWTASSDNIGVTGYRVLRNGSQVTMTSLTSYSNTGLAASTLYSFVVIALDAAGNESMQATASATTIVAADATPPTTAITSPADGAAVSGSITISGTAADNSSLSRVDVSIDAGLYSPAAGTSVWTYALDTMLLANGNHTITARATDSSGNVRTYFIAVSVNNAPPVPTLDKKINIQGKLTDSSGNPISGPKIVTFRLYEASTAPVSAKIWEDAIGVNIANGLFNVTLGQNTPLDPIIFNKPLYVGFQIAGDPSEMAPRQELGASAYAHGSAGDFNAGRNLLVKNNLGIGTQTPSEKLQVEGNALVSGTIRGASWGFGGTYSVDSCNTNTTVNPITNAASCPAGFTPNAVGKFKGADSNCANTLYICVK